MQIYHFPRSSKQRCYYCSYLTDEISKTLRSCMRVGACPKRYLLTAHVYHKITIVSSGKTECISPCYSYIHTVRLYSRFYTRIYTARRDTYPGKLSKRSLFKNMHFNDIHHFHQYDYSDSCGRAGKYR